MQSDSYDVIVIGARVAGAATAMLLATAGLRVLVIDRQERGSNSLSTHAFMRGGVQLLSRWRLLPALRAADTPLVTATTFYYDDDVLRIPIRSDSAVPGLIAPRRDLLDLVLVEAAESAGAEVRHRTKLRGLRFDTQDRVAGIVCEDDEGILHNLAAGLVIGADGIGSTVARLLGARQRLRGRHATSSLFGYVPNLPNTGYHWYYRQDAAAGLIPTNGGDTCVFLSVPTPAFDRSDRSDLGALFGELLLRVSPQLRGTVGAPKRILAFRGRPGYLREAYGPGWALVGDAGFFRDPLTAHGMTDALRDAALLAKAVAEGTEGALRRYQSERDEFAVPMLETTDRIVSFQWTMDELQALHKQLSATMKAEAASISTFEVTRQSDPINA